MGLIKRNIPAFVVLLFTLFWGGKYLFSDSMELYPAYIHAWTQSDRLALAQNFQENGFDFFHPATYNLLTKDGITQVDFPIHDYLVALLSSAFNTDIVSTFRWYMLMYSFLGIIFAFLLILLYTQSGRRALFGAIFLFTLPFFVYYENGFLPSVPSFSNLIIGLYFISIARKQSYQRAIPWITGIFFLTLAALARAPFLIFLFALLVQEFLLSFKERKQLLLRLSIPILGTLLFISYSLYNQHLASTYGSMFLSEALYFTSFSQFFQIMGAAVDRWGNQWLSPYHALLFIALLGSAFTQLRTRGFRNQQNKRLAQYMIIASLGVFCFFFAFGQQFADHDYYYIDSFLPLLFLFLLIGLGQLEISRRWYSTIGTLCFIFFFYFFSYAKQIQTLRYTPPYDDRVAYAYSVYQNAKDDLKAWGVKPTDTLYVLEANSTNIPFTVWGNKGYTNLNSGAQYVSQELDSAFKYAVLLDSFFVASSYRDYPDLIRCLDRVKGNGSISLYKKSKDNHPDRFFENFIGEFHSNFDNESNLNEEATRWIPTEEITDSLGNSLKIAANNEYALTIRDTLRSKLEQHAMRVLFVADYFQNDSSEIQVVCKVGKYYGVHYTINELPKIGEWQQQQFSFNVPPEDFQVGDEIVFYFWNPEKSTLYVDNINLILYQ